ncbi:MAG: malate dehydrogenase [Candidatus Nitrosotenuis sp.]|jgi:malate dehydrogenase (oxaloacetate-decarboxylating)|nr:malate dehydrogenase [Candidatus Nitrosotenuis sp.]
MNTSKKAMALHRKLKGKITVESKIRNLRQDDIKLIYTPGVAFVCEAIYKKPSEKYNLTSKGNNVAIVTDGTRILGLGNIGPYAALPVMEGKTVLYKRFGNVNAFPICLNTVDKDQIINTIKAIEPVFGAINLEDIESPKVLEISAELEKTLSIPVFHDDRHGTAVVALAALFNSLKLVKKPLSSKIILAGAGSAGYGICKLLRFAGCRNLIVVDSEGAIYKGRTRNMNKYKKEIAEITNPKRQKGTLDSIIKNTDVFIGVSGIKGLLSAKMIQSMNKDPIIFALTNPDPEIDPKIAKKAGAKIIATGSYMYENKINNALVFPYLMRVILDKKIRKITLDLLHTTAKAIASTVPSTQLTYNHIMPEIGNKQIQHNISQALKKFK